MKTYPKYKPSGFEWIGDVPEKWYFKSLRRITKEHRQGYYIADEYINEGVKLVRISDLHSDGSIDYSEMPFVKIQESYEKIYSIKDGDFLFPRTGTIGSLGFVKNPERAVFASYLIRFRFKPNEVLNNYLYYYFISKAFLEGVFSDLHGGVVQNIHAENIKNQYIVYPRELLEQEDIINFLDYKTGQIDSFISNRQKQIKLLHDQKSAIINKAVTKGVNPSSKMKPSGIEWLPEVPVNWEVWKMKFLTRIETGNKNTEDAEDDGIYPFYVRSDKVEKISSYSFEGEAILTAGDGVGVAKVYHYAKGKMAIHQRVYKISHFKRVLGKFLYYYIKDNFEKEVIKLSAKTTVDSLRMPMLANFPVAHPSKEEQQVILDFIKKETATIDTLIIKYQKQVDLMQDYRTSLISQAVTGKIDVRNWKPKKQKTA